MKLEGTGFISGNHSIHLVLWNVVKRIWELYKSFKQPLADASL